MARNMVLTYLHLLDPEDLPLIYYIAMILQSYLQLS